MLPLAIALVLLLGTFSPAATLDSASQGSSTPAAKQNAAAAKRLKRQRAHMERQRERLRENRQHLKQHAVQVRERLKAARESLQTQASQSASAQDVEKGEGGNDDEDDSESKSDIWSGFFPWKTDGSFSDNLPTGLGLAAMGVIGALILIFGFLGSYLPSMGGRTEYKALLVEIEALTKRRDQLLGSRENYVRSGEDFGGERRREATSLTQDLTAVIQSKEEEAQRKYRQVVRLGIPIYVLMGGGLAVLLATNALQALLIGFAWTSIIDRLGLKWEEGEKEAVKEESAAKLKRVATDLEAENQSLKLGVSEAIATAAARIEGEK